VDRGWWGIENLSGIPGTVGAFPVQNVGAYGQDAAQVVTAVEVLDLEHEIITTISSADCCFGYRSSIFNREAKGRYIIFAVVFRLSTSGHPQLDYYSVARLCWKSVPVVYCRIQGCMGMQDPSFRLPT